MSDAELLYLAILLAQCALLFPFVLIFWKLAIEPLIEIYKEGRNRDSI